MNITATKEQLLPHLTRALAATDPRVTLPILSHMLIEAKAGTLRVIGSDLETQIISVGAIDQKASMEIAAPAKKLSDVVRMLPDGAEVRMKTEGGKLTIQSGRSRHSLATRDAADYPTFLVSGDKKFTATISASIMFEALRRVRNATAANDVRTYLMGVPIEFRDGVLRTLGSNGHRLSVNEIAVEFDGNSEQVIIPNRSVAEVAKILSVHSDDDVEVMITDSTIHFSVGSVSFSSKLIEGRFPDYRRVLPRHYDGKLVVNAKALGGSLKRIGVIQDQYGAVAFSVADGVIRLRSTNAATEESTDEVPLTVCDCEDVTHGFNTGYLLDSLSTVATDDARIAIADSGAITVQETSDIEWRAIIMPMRI